MDTDERIHALRVDIESLHSNMAQVFETMTATDQRLTEKIDKLAGHVNKLTGDVDRLTGHMTKLTVTMDRLANIVIRHDERLDGIDNGGLH